MPIDQRLTARMEPFDSFWEAPANIEKGYGSFAKFYRRNYLRHVSLRPTDRVLAVSCGPGYFLDVLKKKGCSNVYGIDSDPGKIAYAKARRLDCEVANAFAFLEAHRSSYDMIFAEQEINHLTKTEILAFAALCRQSLKPGGALVVHSLNGANPLTGSEALAQNFDHYNTFTEYSLKQILEHAGFTGIKVFPLQLYIFYENPVNFVGRLIDAFLSICFRMGFIFYGKSNKLFTKKIAAVGRKET